MRSKIKPKQSKTMGISKLLWLENSNYPKVLDCVDTSPTPKLRKSQIYVPREDLNSLRQYIRDLEKFLVSWDTTLYKYLPLAILKQFSIVPGGSRTKFETICVRPKVLFTLVFITKLNLTHKRTAAAFTVYFWWKR